METQPVRTDQKTSKPPYRRSWIDFLISKIEKLPGPAWAFYLTVFLLTCLLNNIILWIDGAIEWGAVDVPFTLGALFLVYGIGFYHYLTGVAEDALHDFYPVLENALNSEEDLEYRLTTLPGTLGWIALFLGTFFGFFDAHASGSSLTLSPFAINYAGVLSAFAYSAFLCLFFLTGRQLTKVVQLHHQVNEIDLFNLKPLRAFSRLTATAGFAIFFIGAFSILVYSNGSDPTLVALYIGVLLLGIIVFIVPLISIRTRINEEKKERILETDQHIKQIFLTVRRSVETGDMAKMGELNTTLSVLEKERMILKGISSYPWDPGTLKSFISTILLPILLWWLKYLFDKWL